MNGVIGSISRWITRCISSSRIIKLVALVSSSISRRDAPASMLSTTLAAWDVLPLASSVQNFTVSFPFGRSLMNMEMSVFRMLRPSSARIFMAVSSVITYSRPSPAIWSYTPSSSALRRVDFPWYPPPTIRVIPLRMPMPVIFPRWGRSSSTFSSSGDRNTTPPFMGRAEMPDSRGRVLPSATNAHSPSFGSISRMKC